MKAINALIVVVGLESMFLMYAILWLAALDFGATGWGKGSFFPYLLAHGAIDVFVLTLVLIAPYGVGAVRFIAARRTTNTELARLSIACAMVSSLGLLASPVVASRTISWLLGEIDWCRLQQDPPVLIGLPLWVASYALLHLGIELRSVEPRPNREAAATWAIGVSVLSVAIVALSADRLRWLYDPHPVNGHFSAKNALDDFFISRQTQALERPKWLPWVLLYHSTLWAIVLAAKRWARRHASIIGNPSNTHGG